MVELLLLQMVELVQNSIAITLQNHTVTIYNAPLTIIFYNGTKVENPYKKELQLCSGLNKLKLF